MKPQGTGDRGQPDALDIRAGSEYRTDRPGRSPPDANSGDCDHGAIWQLLDQAIQETARSEFVRMYEGLSHREDVVRKVEAALESLHLLQTGGEPNYDDPWTALFYLTWYQPRHINLVYSHLRSTNVRLPRKLRVVDLGCGSLATMFALAVFAATSGQQEGHISVHGIDTSWEMRTLGLQLWERFSSTIRTHAGGSGRNSVILARMERVLGRMSSDSGSPSTSLEEYLNGTVGLASGRTRDSAWLSSVHSAYHLPSAMRRATLELAPEAILVTGDYSRRLELEDALRKLDGLGYSFHTASVESEHTGCLMRTTKWRRTLRKWIIDDWDRQWATKFEFDWYLKNEVRWDLNGPIVKQAGTFQ